MAFYKNIIFNQPSGEKTEIPVYDTPLLNGGEFQSSDGIKMYCIIGNRTSPNATNLLYNTEGKVLCKKISYTKQAYTSPGTYNISIPDGIYKIKVTVAGAGGGGSGCAAQSSDKIFNGGAGGNGEIIISTINITKNSYSIIVGAGGKGSLGTTDIDGTTEYGENGESSKAFGIIANGGKGGTSAHTSSNEGFSGKPGISAGNGDGGIGGAGGVYSDVSDDGTMNGKDGEHGWVYIEYGEGIE